MPQLSSEIASRASQRGTGGGADRDRTCDLLIANETLYQLSYDPNRHQQNSRGFSRVHAGECQRVSPERAAHRQAAGGKLKPWLIKFEMVDVIASPPSLAELIRKFEAAREGKAEQTRNTDRSILKALKDTWPLGLAV